MRAKLFVLVSVICGATWLLWPCGQDDESAVQGSAETLVNRVWIERVPDAPNDKFHILAIVDEPAFGVFQHTSFYEGDYSMFSWENLDAHGFDLVMLQNEKSYKLRYSIATKGCRGFDYCMNVKGAPRGVKQYYSMEDWVIEPHGASAQAIAPAQLRQLIEARATK